MATEKQLESFIKDLAPAITYIDNGFNTSLSKTFYLEEGQSAVDFGSLIEGITFDQLIGEGITTTGSGKLKIDFNKGQIVINDGTNDRVLIGDLEDD